MSPDRTPTTTPVLVAAAGAAWEAQALERLRRGGSGIVLAKRCVDLSELLATASTGMASVAVVAPTLPGLDADSVAALRRAGLGVVLVAEPEELLDGDTARLRRLGLEHLLPSTGLDRLVATVTDASASAVPSGRSAPGDHLGAGTAAGAVRATPGRVVAVWGPTGAPGRTTVAVGIATEVARAGRETLLVDADAYGGAVAQHLGVLDEVSGLLAAARAANTGRLDAERLAALARQVDGGLRVLTGLPRPDRWPEVRPTAFADLLDEAARLAQVVVLDLGFSLETGPVDPFGSSAPQRNEMTLASLEGADEVVVVGAADPVALARLARALVELGDVLPGVRPRVVVNRTRPSLGWSDREIRGMVEGFARPVDVHFLPDDRPAADRALMAGQSLAECGDSPLRTAMSDLAHGLLGDAVPPPSRGRRVRRRRAGRDR